SVNTIPCGKDILFDNAYPNHVLKGSLGIRWCPGKNQDYDTCYANTVARYYIPYDYQVEGYTNRICVGYNERGRRLCAALGFNNN
ncbi:MAG: hypothetical protein J5601_06280, partial [Elusimicrobiaceae bacterium]|nr:hypothetical protein [Elusimicrobiaceae bacterium]